jgi:hypothetical protein
LWRRSRPKLGCGAKERERFKSDVLQINDTKNKDILIFTHEGQTSRPKRYVKITKNVYEKYIYSNYMGYPPFRHLPSMLSLKT